MAQLPCITPRQHHPHWAKSSPPVVKQVIAAARHPFLWLSPASLMRAPLPILPAPGFPTGEDGTSLQVGPLSNWVLMVLGEGRGLSANTLARPS